MLSPFMAHTCRCSAGIDGLRDQGVINEIVCKFILDYTSLFGELTEPGPFTIPYIHQVCMYIIDSIVLILVVVILVIVEVGRITPTSSYK